MADKEPRRRKKRRESQKKDEVRSEDHFFTLPKTESRDSDQDAEEDIVIHSHHSPSSLAKIVFVILFSALIISLSFIFISLQDVDRSQVDIFDVSHEDHGETLHDEHAHEASHAEHHGAHEEDEVRLEDFISGLSSIFSSTTEPVEESDAAVPSEETVTEDKEAIDLSTIEPEISTDQGMLEEYVEDTSEQTPESIEMPSASEIYPETSTPYSEDVASRSTYDYSEPEEFSTPTEEPDEPEPPLQTFRNTESLDDEDDDLDSFSIYERADITNEADFEIREQLDEISSILEKELNDDEDDDDDEEEDDGDDDDDEDEDNDEDEIDEGVEEEFDFWQF